MADKPPWETSEEVAPWDQPTADRRSESAAAAPGAKESPEEGVRRAMRESHKVSDAIAAPLGELGLQAASGAYHAVKGGLTGIADVVTGKGTDQATRDIEAETAKTYQPETRGGQLASKVAGYIPQKQAQVARYLGGKAQAGATALGASPEVAGGAGALVETAGNVAGPATLLRKGKAPLSASREVGTPKFEAPPLPEKPRSVQAERVEAARAAGYVLKPSEAGGKVGRVAEGLTGSPRMSIEASLKNQPVTNKLAGEEIGIPAGTRITPASLVAAKQPHNAVYREMANLGEVLTDGDYKSAIGGIGRTPGTSFQKHKNPDVDSLRSAFLEDRFDAKDAVLKIRQLRQSSGKNIRSPDPAKNELGYAERQVADAIEGQLERHATALGHTDLASRFKAARTALAKIHSVEGARVGNTGDISATKLAKMQQKGVPLSGNLKLIADTADEFGEAMRDASKLKNKVPVTVLEGGVGVGGAVLTAAHSPHIGVPMVAGMVARPLTRKYLLSEHYQKKLGKGPARPPKPTYQDPEWQGR